MKGFLLVLKGNEMDAQTQLLETETEFEARSERELVELGGRGERIYGITGWTVYATRKDAERMQELCANQDTQVEIVEVEIRKI